ncbi:MAG TPA: alpha-L-arabinofuranosidase C-terminal domain-containing protein [Armatimonadota bacterium]|jgi:alpha-N-arabinofuranosidase
MERFRLFTTQPIEGPRATLRVDASRPATFTIDRRIFGNFLEHLGGCVYGGVWGQILLNSSFERDPRISRDVARLPWPWEPLGDVKATAVKMAANSELSARLEGRGPEAGVRQRVFLPSHRESRYEGYLYLRAEGDVNRVQVSLRNARDGGEPLAQAELQGIPGTFRRFPFRLQVDPEEAPPLRPVDFCVTFTGPGTVWVDQVLLFPRDAVHGIDPDIIKVAKDWNIPLLRYPGGNFVSGYHWRDGIGPRDQRPSYPNPAWDGMETNQFSTDEFMRFCGLIDAKPHFCVNIGTGTPDEAASWVEYMNGRADTPMGRMRAENGHAKPYGVKLWEVGNEIYGEWQIGHCSALENARRYRAFSQAMLRVDPSLELIGNGEAADNDWNQTLIRECGPLLRHISLHPLVSLPGGLQDRFSLEEIYYSSMAHPWDFEDRFLPNLRSQIQADARTPDNVTAAITEWGIIVGGEWGETLRYPHAENQGGAVYSGCFLNALIRSGEIVSVANITGLLHGGGMKKRREKVYVDPMYWALKLYADSGAHKAVATAVEGACYSVPRRGFLPAVERVPYLDVVACLNRSGSELTLFVTNRHLKQDQEATLELEGFRFEGGRMRTLEAPGMLQRNSEEDPDRIRPRDSVLTDRGTSLQCRFPACSVNAITLRRAQPKA